MPSLASPFLLLFALSFLLARAALGATLRSAFCAALRLLGVRGTGAGPAIELPFVFRIDLEGYLEWIRLERLGGAFEFDLRADGHSSWRRRVQQKLRVQRGLHVV